MRMSYVAIFAGLFILVMCVSCNGDDTDSQDGDDSEGTEISEDGDIDMEAAAVEDENDEAHMEGDSDSDSGGCMVDGDSPPYDSDRDATEGDGDNFEAPENFEESELSENQEQYDSDGERESGLEESDAEDYACPADMVRIDDYCIDRYEASRPDATSSDQGQNSSYAVSRAGVLPWHVNPMTTDHLAEFQSACTAAGKRMCSADEWFQSCKGPNNRNYVWGDVFDREICNCVDTFCDDYCDQNGISQPLCNNAANCGYSCGTSGSGVNCFHVMPTGSFAGCTNVYGHFDINGNVWEIVPVPTSIDSRGYMIRGGAFNCGGASDRLQCTYNAGWQALYAGFRCCKDLETGN